MLSTGKTYRDLGADYFVNRDPERQTKRLVRQLERLGHHVTLAEGAAAASANFSCQARGAPRVALVGPLLPGERGSGSVRRPPTAAGQLRD